MGRRSDASDVAAGTSPWPILVAVGFAASELGVFFGSVPVAVAGLVLFGGSAAGLAHDAGYGATPVGPLVATGGLLVLLGGGILVVRTPVLTFPVLAAAPGADAVARRGMAVVVAGGLLVGVGLLERGIASLGR